MFTFAESFDAWRWRTNAATTGRTIDAAREEWRQLARGAWTRIKASTHYHTGIPCVDCIGCSRYVPQRPAMEEP